MRYSLSTSKRPGLLLAIAICGFQFGCSGTEDRVATYPVSGKVVKAGAPVAYAAVVLHPTQAGDERFTKPRAVTGPDGTFTLTTYDGSDGAPAGDYQVTVEQWVTEKPDEGPKNKLKAKFAKPDTSGLTLTVVEGETPSATFNVN